MEGCEIMRFGKISILMVLFLLLFCSLADATNYTLLNDSNIEAYGYGADWHHELSAVVNSNGLYSNITGIKIRSQIYRNGIKIVDTSKVDTLSPYSVILEGSESSSSQHNSWQLTAMDYYKTGSQTSYTYDGSITSYASN